MVTQKKHTEPSNKELGIKPWPSPGAYVMIAFACAFGWYLISLAI